MLSRSTLSIASAPPRRLGSADVQRPSGARINIGSASCHITHLCPSSPVESGRGGAATDSRIRIATQIATTHAVLATRTRRHAVSSSGRNQRFAPDGTRKRLPHPNARPRSQHGKDRGEPRSQRPQRDDESMHKFGSPSLRPRQRLAGETRPCPGSALATLHRLPGRKARIHDSANQSQRML